MEDQHPNLPFVEKEDRAPVKRRRPALSCIACRSRKVKCDRLQPCGPCRRTKQPDCAYKPNQHTKRRHEKSPTTADNYVAPETLGEKESVRSHTLSSRPETNLGAEDLMRKLRELEGKLDAITEGAPLQQESTPKTPGQFLKSKFYGETHWMNSIEPYEALGNRDISTNPTTDRPEINKSSELYNAVLECKKLARILKAARMSDTSLAPEVISSIPSKDVCDQLVKCYLRTYEEVFRVLHVPGFMDEYEKYWQNRTTAKSSSLIKILLVCAIGVPFYTGVGKAPLRASCTKWIQAAERWLNAPHEKSRLTLTGIQIHCLILSARQVCCVGGDLIWMPAGSLLRNAMHIGLHRDPSHFPKISPFHAEMRRRLWATIMEVTVQTSLDVGMPPMISLQDFDALPPSNIRDEDISESAPTPPQSRPATELTQTSIQIALAESLPLRLEITRQINTFRSSISYDATLRLSNELAMVCRSKLHFFQIQTRIGSSLLPSPFAIKMLDTLVRRFILSLHRPLFTLAKTDPKFYYSRKVCLDTSLAIMNPAGAALHTTQSHMGETERGADEDDWHRLLSSGVGFVKSFTIYSVTTIYLELLSQLEEMRLEASAYPTLQHGTVGMLPPHLVPLRHVLAHTHAIAQTRLRNAETNAKGVVFFACALAKVDALASGNMNPEKAVLNAAKEAIKESGLLMRKAYKDEWGVELDAAVGEGVDHVGINVGGGGQSRAGMSIELGASGSMDMSTDMDWDAFMGDSSMGFGEGFDFGLDGGDESWMFGDWSPGTGGEMGG